MRSKIGFGCFQPISRLLWKAQVKVSLIVHLYVQPISQKVIKATKSAAAKMPWATSEHISFGCRPFWSKIIPENHPTISVIEKILDFRRQNHILRHETQQGASVKLRSRSILPLVNRVQNRRNETHSLQKKTFLMNSADKNNRPSKYMLTHNVVSVKNRPFQLHGRCSRSRVVKKVPTGRNRTAGNWKKKQFWRKAHVKFSIFKIQNCSR